MGKIVRIFIYNFEEQNIINLCDVNLLEFKDESFKNLYIFATIDEPKKYYDVLIDDQKYIDTKYNVIILNILNDFKELIGELDIELVYHKTSMKEEDPVHNKILEYLKTNSIEIRKETPISSENLSGTYNAMRTVVNNINY